MNATASLRAGLTGLGQIMLQDNPYTGLLLLVGVAVGSLPMALGMVLGVAAGTLPAYLLGGDRTRIARGLYGFNGALVGLALTCFFVPGPLLWLGIAAGAALSSLLAHHAMDRAWPVFSLPFMVVTWALAELLPALGVSPVSVAALPGDMPDIAAVANGFGQVLFQGNVLSGALFVAAVFVASPLAALFAALGAAVAVLFAHALGLPAEQIGFGLYAYDAVLCAIVFAGERRQDTLLALLAVLLSVVAQGVLSHLMAMPLTLGFVLATWLTAGARRVRRSVTQRCFAI